MAARVAAWLVTGPLGHFAGGLLDWLAFARALAAQRLARALTRR
jgi:hypothetical protein